MGLSNMTALEKAHAEIVYIYFDILPKHGMEVRDGSIALCHYILNAFSDKHISLCHARVGSARPSPTSMLGIAKSSLQRYESGEGNPIIAVNYDLCTKFRTVFKGVGFIDNTPTWIFSYAVALIILIAATFFTGDLTAEAVVLCVVKSVVVSPAANNAFDAVSKMAK